MFCWTLSKAYEVKLCKKGHFVVEKLESIFTVSFTSLYYSFTVSLKKVIFFSD